MLELFHRLSVITRDFRPKFYGKGGTHQYMIEGFYKI